MIGYPSERKGRRCEMTSVKYGVDEDVIWYKDMAGKPGCGGSPVYGIDDEKITNPRVIGIHSGHRGEKGYAVRMTGDKWKWVKNVVNCLHQF